MKLDRFVCRTVCFSWVLLAVLVNFATAGPIATCGLVNICTPMCGNRSSGVPCIVRVSRAANGATATVQNLSSGIGQPNANICVSSGTLVVWLTEEGISNFSVDFGTTHAFANTGTFTGTNLQPASDKVNPASATANCYQYTIQHCINTTDCKTADPKVIVTNVLVPPKRHRASKQPPKK